MHYHNIALLWAGALKGAENKEYNHYKAKLRTCGEYIKAGMDFKRLCFKV